MKLAKLVLLSAALSVSTVALADNIPTTPTPMPDPRPTPAAVQVAIPNPPQVAAKAYLLMDYGSGQILFGDKIDEKLPPASLTKMMTSYIVGQELKSGRIKNTDMVTVSKNAWAKNYDDSSKMFIEVGKQVSVGDLNKGIIIDSGNDACVAMAEFIAGSEDSFVGLMNEWAAKIGMTSSHFMNAHGLYDENHFSTARDLSTLARHLIHDQPTEYTIYAQKDFTYNGITQHNRNKLLWDTTMNVDGMKTGHVSEVGYNLVASAVGANNTRLIAVVIGASSESSRAAEAKKMLTYGFRFYQNVEPYKNGAELAKQRIWMGDKSEIRLGTNQDISMMVPRGAAAKLKADFQLDRELRAPIKAGETVGTIFLRVDGKDVAKYPLVALETVDEGGIFSRLWDYLVLLFQQLFS